jgi:hypothetical protein
MDRRAKATDIVAAAIAKAGTSEGAKKAWQKRERAKAEAPKPKPMPSRDLEVRAAKMPSEPPINRDDFQRMRSMTDVLDSRAERIRAQASELPGVAGWDDIIDDLRDDAKDADQFGSDGVARKLDKAADLIEQAKTEFQTQPKMPPGFQGRPEGLKPFSDWSETFDQAADLVERAHAEAELAMRDAVADGRVPPRPPLTSEQKQTISSDMRRGLRNLDPDLHWDPEEFSSDVLDALGEMRGSLQPFVDIADPDDPFGAALREIDDIHDAVMEREDVPDITEIERRIEEVALNLGVIDRKDYKLHRDFERKSDHFASLWGDVDNYHHPEATWEDVEAAKRDFDAVAAEASQRLSGDKEKKFEELLYWINDNWGAERDDERGAGQRVNEIEHAQTLIYDAQKLIREALFGEDPKRIRNKARAIVADALLKAGTSEGAKRAWDKRGRGKKEKKPKGRKKAAEKPKLGKRLKSLRAEIKGAKKYPGKHDPQFKKWSDALTEVREDAERVGDFDLADEVSREMRESKITPGWDYKLGEPFETAHREETKQERRDHVEDPTNQHKAWKLVEAYAKGGRTTPEQRKQFIDDLADIHSQTKDADLKEGIRAVVFVAQNHGIPDPDTDDGFLMNEKDATDWFKNWSGIDPDEIEDAPPEKPKRDPMEQASLDDWHEEKGRELFDRLESFGPEDMPEETAIGDEFHEWADRLRGDGYSAAANAAQDAAKALDEARVLRGPARRRRAEERARDAVVYVGEEERIQAERKTAAQAIRDRMDEKITSQEASDRIRAGTEAIGAGGALDSDDPLVGTRHEWEMSSIIEYFEVVEEHYMSESMKHLRGLMGDEWLEPYTAQPVKRDISPEQQQIADMNARAAEDAAAEAAEGIEAAQFDQSVRDHAEEAGRHADEARAAAKRGDAEAAERHAHQALDAARAARKAAREALRTYHAVEETAEAAENIEERLGWGEQDFVEAFGRPGQLPAEVIESINAGGIARPTEVAQEIAQEVTGLLTDALARDIIGESEFMAGQERLTQALLGLAAVRRKVMARDNKFHEHDVPLIRGIGHDLAGAAKFVSDAATDRMRMFERSQFEEDMMDKPVNPISPDAIVAKAINDLLLEKAGTSEGAKKAWDKRKRAYGGPGKKAKAEKLEGMTKRDQVRRMGHRFESEDTLLSAMRESPVKPIPGSNRIVATADEIKDARESAWADWDLRAKNRKRATNEEGRRDKDIAKLGEREGRRKHYRRMINMANSITNWQKAITRGEVFDEAGMKDAAQLFFSRGALLRANQQGKLKKSAEEGASTLASFLYPGWARPGSRVAARYDDKV